MQSPAPQEPLRQKVLRGSGYLIIQHSVTVVGGLFGMLLLTRVLGPGIYGLFSAAQGIFGYLSLIGLMGTNIYLIRERQNASMELFHLAFWWLLFWGTVLTGCALLIFLLIATLWTQAEGFLPAVMVMCALLPLSLIAQVPAALLERELHYQRTALVETSALIGFYVTAIPLAWLKYGLWAPVAGFLVQQSLLIGGFFLAARYRPRWYWNRQQLRAMLGYSVSQAASYWVYSTHNLVPSLIVLPLAGKEVVGYLAIAGRLLNILSVFLFAALRISMPAFAHVQHDLTRLTRAVNQAMQLQTLALGLSFAGFIVVAPYVLPLLLGARWHTPTILTIFAFLAVRYLLAALFGIQGSALYVKKENLTMLLANIAFAVSFFAFTYGLMVMLPMPYRLYGYLAAEFLAHLPNYYIVDRGFRRVIGQPDYLAVLLWITAFSCILFASLVSGWLYLGAGLLLLLPPSRRQIGVLYREMRAHRG